MDSKWCARWQLLFAFLHNEDNVEWTIVECFAAVFCPLAITRAAKVKP